MGREGRKDVVTIEVVEIEVVLIAVESTSTQRRHDYEVCRGRICKQPMQPKLCRH